MVLGRKTTNKNNLYPDEKSCCENRTVYIAFKGSHSSCNNSFGHICVAQTPEVKAKIQNAGTLSRIDTATNNQERNIRKSLSLHSVLGKPFTENHEVINTIPKAAPKPISWRDIKLVSKTLQGTEKGKPAKKRLKPISWRHPLKCCSFVDGSRCSLICVRRKLN